MVERLSCILIHTGVPSYGVAYESCFERYTRVFMKASPDFPIHFLKNSIDVGNAAQRKALMAQQQPMGAHARTSGRMKAMHVGQSLEFQVAERGYKFHIPSD